MLLRPCGEMVEAFSPADALELLFEVQCWVVGVGVGVVLAVFNLFGDDVFGLRLQDGVERQEGVADEGSGEAEALFALGAGGFVSHVPENEDAKDRGGEQKERMGEDCAKVHDTPRRVGTRNCDELRANAGGQNPGVFLCVLD